MKKGKNVDSISTFLGCDACIEGTIEFRGTIRIDGNVKGKICSNGGTVIIGEKAVVNAEIDVGAAIIMGQVNGAVNAGSKIEIYPPGRVVGNIQAQVILIEAGVTFNGRCFMKARTVSSEKAADSTDKHKNHKDDKN